MGLFDIFGGAITSAWSSAARDESQELMNSRNIEFQRETNKLNEQLWREKFDYDKWQYLNTLAYNSKEAREAFEREAQWNSPVNQMFELRKAGVNPFSVFGQNGSVASVHSSPASGANSSSSAPPQMIAPQMQYSFQNSGLAATLQMVDAVANVIDKISSSSLRGSQKKEIDTLLLDNLKKLQAETDNEKAKAALNNLALEFEQTFGYAMRDQNLQNAVADYEKTVSDIAKNIAEGNLIDEKVVTEQTQQELNRILKKKHGSERELLQKQVDAFETRLHQEIRESNSRIKSNLATAEESSEKAKTERENRVFIVGNNAMSFEKLSEDLRIAINENDTKIIENWIRQNTGGGTNALDKLLHNVMKQIDQHKSPDEMIEYLKRYGVIKEYSY